MRQRSEIEKQALALGKMYYEQGFGPRKRASLPARAAQPPPPPPAPTAAQTEAARLATLTDVQRAKLLEMDRHLPGRGGSALTSSAGSEMELLYPATEAAARARMQEMIEAGQVAGRPAVDASRLVNRVLDVRPLPGRRA